MRLCEEISFNVRVYNIEYNIEAPFCQTSLMKTLKHSNKYFESMSKVIWPTYN